MRSQGQSTPSTQPHPREERQTGGRPYYTQGRRIPKGPDLFTMCPVAFDGNSIAFCPLSEAWLEREGGYFVRKPGGVPWGLGWAALQLQSDPGLGSLVLIPQASSPLLKVPWLCSATLNSWCGLTFSHWIFFFVLDTEVLSSLFGHLSIYCPSAHPSITSSEYPLIHLSRHSSIKD